MGFSEFDREIVYTSFHMKTCSVPSDGIRKYETVAMD